jgi:hypothetical protein
MQLIKFERAFKFLIFITLGLHYFTFGILKVLWLQKRA